MTGQNSSLRLLQSLFSDSPPHMRLIMLVILMGMGILLTSFLGILLAIPLFSVSWNEIQLMVESGFEGGDMNFLRYMQAVQTVGLFIIPALLANHLLFTPGKGVFNSIQGKYFFVSASLILLTLVLAAPLINQLIYLNSAIHFPASLSGLEQKLMEMEQERAGLTDKMLTGTGAGSLLINLFIIALLPAVGEEFLFRGILQRLLGSWFRNQHLAVLITAIIFSAFHLQFFGFIPRMVLGLYFGYLLYWSSDIWLSVIAHFINNAMAVLIIYFTREGTGILEEWMGNAYINRLLPLFLSAGFTLLLVLNTKRFSSRGRMAGTK